MKAVATVLVALMVGGLTACNRNCFAGEEDVADRTINLDEVVDARLLECGGNDVWDITLDPGQYRLEVQSDHTSWALVYTRSGESADTAPDQCGLAGGNTNCVVSSDRKMLSFTVAQATAGQVHVQSRWLCETPVPDCPGNTYAYQLVVHRCVGSCPADAGP